MFYDFYKAMIDTMYSTNYIQFMIWYYKDLVLYSGSQSYQKKNLSREM
jgi:hypothetical protein